MPDPIPGAELPIVDIPAAPVVADIPAPVAAPAPEVAANPPAVDAPIAAPEAPAQPDGAAAAALVADAPKPEDKPADAAPEVKPSLLAEAGKDETKPAETAAADTKPAEGTAPALTYETMALPEGLSAAPAEMKGYADLLTKHGISPEVGQELLALHGTALKSFTDAANVEQHRVFNATRDGWRKEIMGDNQLGGAGFETTKKAVARMRDQFASSAKAGTPQYEREMAEFNNFLNVTGSGDHPALWRFLHNVARRHDEPLVPRTTGNPTKTNGQPPGQRGPKALYGNPNRAN